MKMNHAPAVLCLFDTYFSEIFSVPRFFFSHLHSFCTIYVCIYVYVLYKYVNYWPSCCKVSSHATVDADLQRCKAAQRVFAINVAKLSLSENFFSSTLYIKKMSSLNIGLFKILQIKVTTICD